MRLGMLTRLHSDIYRVDEVLARTFNMVSHSEHPSRAWWYLMAVILAVC